MKNFFKNYASILFMLAGIVGGCVLGAIFPATETSAGATVLKPLGTLFINMMFCIVVPMVFASIAGAVANMGNRKRAGKIMGTTIGTFVVTGAIAAAIDETIQRFSPDRGPSIKDVGIDTCGVIAGILVLTLLHWLFTRKKR